MKKGFEQQLCIGKLLIEDATFNLKTKNALDELLLALQMIYKNKEYNSEIFSILERLNVGKKKTGRKGMDLWSIFVLAQVRLCLNMSYDNLHNLSNNHMRMRQIMGIAHNLDFPQIQMGYQNIYDNVSLLSDEMLKDINAVILKFGHSEVFKKKEDTALHLKTDSFVVESNVHFPTDYNLLWDCARKCTDMISKFLKKYDEISGWRKLKNWKYEIKRLMRELGKASSSGGKNKDIRVKTAAAKYLKKTQVLVEKINQELPSFPQKDQADLAFMISLIHFKDLMNKHIDLVRRRIIEAEVIPHEEKMFSVFETYTEFIKKGKSHPNVELGKKAMITTNQFGLIADYLRMEKEQDREMVVELGERLLPIFTVSSWSFDKGYWSKTNKEFLEDHVENVIMPKLGKRTKAEIEEEKSHTFKQLKNKHSAIESNINELEHRGLDRCPDRGIVNFEKYISLAVCAYNLKKIGREIIRQENARRKKEREKERKNFLRKAA